MKDYQDTETGSIYAFEDGVDPQALNYKSIPVTLSEIVKVKPDESYVWYESDWIKQELAPQGYIQPGSNVEVFDAAWMAFLLPYSAVHRNENSGLNITLDQINANSYDGNKLSEVVASLPLTTSTTIPALISYDGAIAIPQCGDFPSNIDGVRGLNEILCSMLLGGIHTEVIHATDLVPGTLQDNKNIFAYTPSLNNQLRLNCAALIDRLPLIHPRVLKVEDIQKAYSQGQQAIKSVPRLSPFFLLNGFTSMMYLNTNDALSNFWIAVEQITEHLWHEHYIKHKASFHPRIAKCHNKAKGKRNSIDNISAKHKLLRLSKIISKKCYQALDMARLKRNKLAHDGVSPSQEVIQALWESLPDLIEQASGIRELGARNLLGSCTQSWPIPTRTNFDKWEELANQLHVSEP